CVSGTDNVKHQNEVELFGEIDPKVCSLNYYLDVYVFACIVFILSCFQESKHRRTDRSVLCCIRKAEPGKTWVRLTKAK
ncbi:hypothetical protein NL108_001515, partial [Boleophthalmus pectinirostris]